MLSLAVVKILILLRWRPKGTLRTMKGYRHFFCKGQEKLSEINYIIITCPHTFKYVSFLAVIRAHFFLNDTSASASVFRLCLCTFTAGGLLSELLSTGQLIMMAYLWCVIGWFISKHTNIGMHRHSGSSAVFSSLGSYSGARTWTSSGCVLLDQTKIVDMIHANPHKTIFWIQLT